MEVKEDIRTLECWMNLLVLRMEFERQWTEKVAFHLGCNDLLCCDNSHLCELAPDYIRAALVQTQSRQDELAKQVGECKLKILARTSSGGI